MKATAIRIELAHPQHEERLAADRETGAVDAPIVGLVHAVTAVPTRGDPFASAAAGW